MKELVKGQLDWHETVNENFKEVGESVGDKLNKPEVAGKLNEGFMYYYDDKIILKESGGGGGGFPSVEDFLKYADENYGISDVPVGSIVAFMLDEAPKHYLKCDGTVYQIEQYPDLAEEINKQFGKYDYWGSDGANTFAVPDLRAEFLRGWDTADRDTGSGAAVGEHQEPTAFPKMYLYANHYYMGTLDNVSNTLNEPMLKNIDKDWEKNKYVSASYTNGISDNTSTPSYTSRPTNTSVLWCIKCEPTYFVNVEGGLSDDSIISDKEEFESNEEEGKVVDALLLKELISAGAGGGNPVGEVIAYMGTEAPDDYLACDGQTYDIANYKKLAEHIKTHFGKYDYFGGDGETTFAVPKLKGEFLRGWDDNAYTNQGSGAAVGEHQDGTESSYVFTYTNIPQVYSYTSSSGTGLVNPDNVMRGANAVYKMAVTKDVDIGSGPPMSMYASRPTNTSVMWCIRYKKSISVFSDYWEMLEANNISVEVRRRNFRGKNLGSVITPEQRANIANGSFKGFFLGDYWVINGRIWRIVDFNYWLGTGDVECVTPHLVIMCDRTLYDQRMNSTDITTGAYVGSEMRTIGLNNAKNIVNDAFGAENILNHREYLHNAMTNGYPSAGAWYDSTVELPNEPMMYGSYIYTPSGNGNVVVNRVTIGRSQLALMQIHPKWICPHKESQSLRDAVMMTNFACVSSLGGASSTGASIAIGVRVVFGLTGAA